MAGDGSHIIQFREDPSQANPGSVFPSFASWFRLPLMQEDPTTPLNHEHSGSAEMPPLSEVWGTFRLQARVGHGSFGEVYRAWDPHLEREVALKLLLPGSVEGEEEYKSMLREARALAAVQHPNIVHVYGIDRHDGRVGYWTDFVRGKTLSFLVLAQGPFGYREAALIGLDVAKALSAVHRARLLHRDIKAENVMREEGGRILLMDFGLSTLPQRQTGVAGTPNYMAPELFNGGQATVATDIYAVGVLLFFLVTGQHPVRLGGLTAREAATAISKRRALIDLRPDLSESFMRTVSVAMEMDPAKRYGSAGQLAEALAESLGAPLPAGMTSVPSKAANKTTLWVGIAAVLLLAVAGLALWLAGIPHRLHAANGAATAGVPATQYDQFLKAQDLLQHYYKQANISAAVSGFQEVLKADPNFALAQAGLGQAYFLQYRDSGDAKLLDMAKEATAKAVQIDANLAPPYITMARMEAMQGHTQLAMQQVQKAIALDPHSAEAYGALAEVYETDGRTGDALTAVQRAIDLAPDDWRWPVRLGTYYFGAGRLKEAALQLEKGVQLAPQNWIADYDLGVARMQLGQLDEARGDLEKALSMERDPDTYRALGSLLMLQGKYKEAIDMDKQSIDLRPGDYHTWGNLGGAYLWAAGGREQSMNAYRKAIDLAEAQRLKSPDDPNLLVELADDYASSGQIDRSEVLVRKALALSPNDPNVNYRAGETYEIMGRRAAAIPLIAKALAQGYHATEFQRSPELASLRSDPAFQSALNKAKSENAVDSAKKLN
jgi:eukaryotic-like serine/threonine-protein kinase